MWIVPIKDQLEHYETALELIKLRPIGICSAVEEVMREEYHRKYNADIYFNPVLHSVFYKYKKMYSTNGKTYWFLFNEDGKLKRVQVLEMMINDCKKEINEMHT